jgi:hypothetical protein
VRSAPGPRGLIIVLNDLRYACRRMRLPHLGCVLAVAGLLAGCGSKAASPPSATATAAAPTATPAQAKKTPSPAPALTSAPEIAACAELEQAIQAVSQLVGHATEAITQALHPQDLAKRMETAQRSLVDSAKLIGLVHAPNPLAGSQRQLAGGLRKFAADFGRAKASAAKGDIAKAAQQTVDEDALRTIQTSAKRIDDRCGA